ncbi:tRNA(Ile)-lysidine synthase [Chlamydiales bacterium STE3]|nr:tRNA(Ile)-lysidine synthase [Chlamydiales bacterium STE3]
MRLSCRLESFFKKKTFKRLLVGLSGGPDSLALLFLLMTLCKKYSFEIGVAHINHGWRKESAEEAHYLERLSGKLKLPFFLHTLNPALLKGNLENASRNERLAFFQKVCKEEKYDALVLAHHADDQAETVLKRCLEGANLFALHGMEAKSKWKEMTILRPLLFAHKKELLDYLQQLKISYFTDSTNSDERFLRGRMRKKILPFINQEFGKNIRDPLCRLGQNALELNEYVQLRVKTMPLNRFEGSLGSWIDFNRIECLLEIKWVVMDFFKKKCMNFHFDIVNKIASFLHTKQANKEFAIGGKVIYCDRGYFFCMKAAKDRVVQETVSIKKQEFCLGEWKIKLEKFKRSDNEQFGWKFAFSGLCRVILPFGDYFVSLPQSPTQPLLDRLWTQGKVPAFLRYQVPAIYDSEGSIAHEFLSGKKLLTSARGENDLTVSLYRE